MIISFHHLHYLIEIVSVGFYNYLIGNKDSNYLATLIVLYKNIIFSICNI